MQRHRTLAVLALGCLVLCTMAAVPSTTVRAPRPCTAAIALRDLVPAEQMLGTKLFTWPLLAASYDHVTYLEASDGDDGRVRVQAALAAERAAQGGEACSVDLLFLAHGDQFAAWVEELPKNELPPLRLVYDTGAGDATQGERWLALGARAFVGHPGNNVAPVFYAFFLPAWLGGATVEDAVASSNMRTFAILRGTRAYLGDESASLWRGTRARLFGDARTAKP
ncbi:MAG: hypothetical protein IT383_20875 [Deltaproteobacteria bacterium]|nr:hypothetical protein [Deltaproteobacteria bacterium]